MHCFRCGRSVFEEHPFLFWCYYNHKLDEDLRHRGIITTPLELFCTIIYHSELIF